MPGSLGKNFQERYRIRTDLLLHAFRKYNGQQKRAQFGGLPRAASQRGYEMTRTGAQSNLRKAGLLIIAVSIALSIIYLLFQQQLVGFIAYYLSSDHQITPDGERQLTALFYCGMALLLGLGFVLVKAQSLPWRARMKQVILEEPLCPSAVVQPSPRLVLVVSPLAGLLLMVSIRVAYHIPSMFSLLYAKDHGVLDLFVPIVFIISAVLVGAAVWKMWRNSQFAKRRVVLLVFYLLIIGAFVVYAGEETSWGQDFFGWQTPQLFSGNVEGQTNIHNYFNKYFEYGYMALALVSVIVLVSLWLEYKQRWIPYNRLILPHPSLIGLSLLITVVAIVWFSEQELLEEMVAVFVLCYSLRLFTCLRSKSLSIETQTQ